MRLLRPIGVALAVLLLASPSTAASQRIAPRLELRAPREVRSAIEADAQRLAGSASDSSAVLAQGLARIASRLLEEGCLEATLRLVVAPSPDSARVLSIDAGAIASWDTLIVTRGALSDSGRSGPEGAARPFDPARRPSFSARRFEQAMGLDPRLERGGFPFAAATVESVRARRASVGRPASRPRPA
ncbi:MAG: hypothetical protein U0527_08210 [Candidatus Eisenbacteria bacterium]